MQAIIVSYLSPTDTKGARLKAKAARHSVTIPYPHELRNCEKYRAAANALCDRLDWPKNKLIEGHLSSGSSVFVFNYE